MGKYLNIAKRALSQSEVSVDTAEDWRRSQDCFPHEEQAEAETRQANRQDAPRSELSTRPSPMVRDGDLDREASTTLTTETTKAPNISAEPSRRSPVCFACKTSRFWLSIHGVTVCGLCHPPGSPDLVAEWIKDNSSDA